MNVRPEPDTARCGSSGLSLWHGRLFSLLTEYMPADIISGGKPGETGTGKKQEGIGK